MKEKEAKKEGWKKNLVDKNLGFEKQHWMGTLEKARRHCCVGKELDLEIEAGWELQNTEANKGKKHPKWEQAGQQGWQQSTKSNGNIICVVTSAPLEK